MSEHVTSRARGLLCAALLAAGRPLGARELATVLGVAQGEVASLVAALQAALQAQDLGLVVEEVAGGYRLVVDPALTPALSPLLAPPPLPALSAAALETLALVAYQQPITRGELEAARGASCASTLETLQERELIKVVGRKEVIGRPLLYGTTERFLLEFGLKSLQDLPPLEEAPTDFLRG
ncbi:SMC-Scp complex subunit ScpB [Truepera radiovictrix]|uniref:SMC-Scp complex subunit ScpB n=1 Tax=Truepera radiovictrix TaxID=332249 RepID=UPI00247A51B4|nr:SMC-Scp complex subunit ScpB [Truepera radiovictrix]WMT57008.1 SMC-Scp complex subunit ScpB [Truepera radiovictrix]